MSGEDDEFGADSGIQGMREGGEAEAVYYDDLALLYH